MSSTKKYIALILLIIGTILVISCDNKNEEAYNGVFSGKGALAIVNTTSPTSITDTSAISGGNLTNTGESYITAYGVCWSTETNPEITDSKTEDGKEPGELAQHTDLLAGDEAGIHGRQSRRKGGAP